MLQDYNAPTYPRMLDITYQESIKLQLLIEYQIKPNWDWLMTVMDSTEARLRFGSAHSNLSPESGQFPAGLYTGGQRGGGGDWRGCCLRGRDLRAIREGGSNANLSSN
jgi:hypothetical protein